MEKGPEKNRALEFLIVDASSQITNLNLHTAEEFKKFLSEGSYEVKTLELQTGKTREEIEKSFSGICDEYNAIVEEIKRGQFDEVRFREIIQETLNINRFYFKE
jgi:hypothetical protein